MIRRPDDEPEPPASRRDRGQLLLVGAVAVALVLMGLVVVFNTVLFTDTTSPTEGVESAREAKSTNLEVAHDVRRILRQVAHESGSTASYEDMVRENISTYNQLLMNSTAQTGPVFVNVIVHDVSETSLVNCGLNNCANISVVYQTDDFTYNTTTVVGVNP